MTSGPLCVTLTAAPGYEVRVGDKHLGYFRVTGEMEGMRRLVDAEGRVLVVDTGGPFTSFFAQELSGGSDAVVIKASGNLADQLTNAMRAAANAEVKP